MQLTDPQEPSFLYGTQLTTKYLRLIMLTLCIYETNRWHIANKCA